MSTENNRLDSFCCLYKVKSEIISQNDKIFSNEYRSLSDSNKASSLPFRFFCFC
jgi:hypothetical protein